MLDNVGPAPQQALEQYRDIVYLDEHLIGMYMHHQRLFIDPMFDYSWGSTADSGPTSGMGHRYIVYLDEQLIDMLLLPPRK